LKKAILIFIIILITASCTTSRFSTSGDEEKKFISNFLSYMDHSSEPAYDDMMRCISHQYISKNKIDKAHFKVDNYTIWGYSIEDYHNDGKVTAKVWGNERGWIHLLTFKLSKESGKLYIVPSQHSTDYISPWWERQTYVKE
jgi:hypothetical protein